MNYFLRCVKCKRDEYARKEVRKFEHSNSTFLSSVNKEGNIFFQSNFVDIKYRDSQ